MTSAGAKPVACTADAPDLDEAAVKAKSLAFLDANDRLDVPAVTAQLGASFVELQQGWFYDKETLLKVMTSRKSTRAPASMSRTWKSQQVHLGHGTATFIGEAVVSLVMDDAGSPMTFDGWNTLVWVREGLDWKVAHWQWQKAGLDADRDRWNEEYRRGIAFNPEPNQLLVDTVKGRPKGVALDLLMGQGRNTVYLASQGWKVTGIDISDTGIRIARENAAKKNVVIDAVEADVDTWDLGRERWDLVTMIYAGTDHAMLERIKTALKKGGVIVVEVFHKSSTFGVGSSGFETGELAPLFKDGFEILRDDVVEDRADWGLQPTKLVRFVAQKK